MYCSFPQSSVLFAKPYMRELCVISVLKYTGKWICMPIASTSHVLSTTKHGTSSRMHTVRQLLDVQQRILQNSQRKALCRNVPYFNNTKLFLVLNLQESQKWFSDTFTHRNVYGTRSGHSRKHVKLCFAQVLTWLRQWCFSINQCALFWQ